jgi:hypothetical protein
LNAQGRYDRLPGEELDSAELGLRLVVREGWLRLLNPATNTLLATNTEKDDEIARLRIELARLRGEAPDA